MSFRKEDWPLTAAQLESVIALRETTLVEFKREWWTGSGGEAKAKIARGVMALANTVGRDELGLLVIGVGDESVGGAIVPVVGAPEGEAVVQILSGYMSPPANIDCRHYDLITGRVSVIAVFHSPARPHHPTREYSEVLSTREVYVRRGKQVGVLTVPELERMIRDDLRGEYAAIEMYRSYIKLAEQEGDPVTRRLLEETLATEEGHANDWETVLGK